MCVRARTRAVRGIVCVCVCAVLPHAEHGCAYDAGPLVSFRANTGPALPTTICVVAGLSECQNDTGADKGLAGMQAEGVSAGSAHHIFSSVARALLVRSGLAAEVG